MNETAKALLNLISSMQPVTLQVGTVSSVDRDRATVDVDPANGDPAILDVRIRPVIDQDDSGLISFPSVGSQVVVAMLQGSDNTACVLLKSEIEEVSFKMNGLTIGIDTSGKLDVAGKSIALGDGSREKAVKGETLNERLGELIQLIRDLITVLTQFSATGASASTGPLAPLAPAFSSLAPSLQPVSTAANLTDSLLGNHLSQTTETA